MTDATELLARVALFTALSDADRSAIATVATWREHPAGSPIVREGDDATSMYVIADGRARVLVGGRPRRDLGPGDAFGEVALLDGGQRTATVYAVTATTTLTIDGEAFAALRGSGNAFDASLLTGLCGRLRSLESDHWSAAEERRLRDLQATFLANAGHELRTPLTAGLGFVQVARRLATAAPERLDDALASAERGLQVLRALIDDLLDYTRSQGSEGGLQLDTYPLDALVEAAVGASGIGVDRVVTEVRTETVADVDGARVVRIITALLENAARFGPDGGVIRIGIDGDEDQVSVSVADAGSGIDPETMATMFEVFTQGDPSATRRRGGMGLGLPLARSLARLHGGDVTCETGAPTTFRLRLPRRPRVVDA